MERPYQYIEVERHDDVFCVRLRVRRLLENELLEMADELVSLIIDGGCRKLALALGPTAPECMYSVFLAKLIMVRRRLKECGGALRIYGASPDVIGLFEACHLKEFFEFLPDKQAAIDSLSAV
jgi:hypothetical protein